MDDRLASLLAEYDRALAHTDALWRDLTPEEVAWRPHENASAVGWHLGHQAAVAHFLIRNLIAAETSPDPELDELMDSATPEPHRGELPPPDRLAAYRHGVAERVRRRVEDIRAGDVGAPDQMRLVAEGVLTAIVNHEYQHSQWIGEVREHDLGKPLPPRPTSPLLRDIDGYLVLASTSAS